MPVLPFRDGRSADSGSQAVCWEAVETIAFYSQFLPHSCCFPVVKTSRQFPFGFVVTQIFNCLKAAWWLV